MKSITAFVLAVASLSAQQLTRVDELGYSKLVSSNKGRVVVVNFWATWCAPCRAEMPALIALGSKLKPKGLELLLVSADEPEEQAAAHKFLTSNKAPMPSYLKVAKDDDKFIRSIDPKWSGALPATFVYDRAGRKVRSFFGEVSMPELEAAIKKVL